jgi:predicted RecA/RadA family phage recombinase
MSAAGLPAPLSVSGGNIKMGQATQIQKGRTISYTNGGAADIKYGDVIDLDTRIAIAAEDIAIGATGSASVEDVYELPAIDTAAFTQGQTVYWDPVAKKVTDVGEGLTRAGWCIVGKLQAGTTAQVKIN